MYKHRNHCLIGGNHGFLAAQKKTETTSPFYDLDVFDIQNASDVTSDLSNKYAFELKQEY